ncbi:MAG: hypothetical protein RR376_07345 [Janthinobacterium sp.]
MKKTVIPAVTIARVKIVLQLLISVRKLRTISTILLPDSASIGWHGRKVRRWYPSVRVSSLAAVARAASIVDCVHA